MRCCFMQAWRWCEPAWPRQEGVVVVRLRREWSLQRASRGGAGGTAFIRLCQCLGWLLACNATTVIHREGIGMPQPASRQPPLVSVRITPRQLQVVIVLVSILQCVCRLRWR